MLSAHQSNHLNPALIELILETGECAQLCRTHRGEISRVREENGPFVTNELMEVDLALGSHGFEVGSWSGSAENLGKCRPVERLPVEPRRRRGCSV